MPLGMKVGLGPGHTVLDGDPALPQKGDRVAPLPHISAHVYCVETAGWIKMPFGTEVGLGPGHIVLDGTQLRRPKGAQQPSPTFRPMSIVAKWLDGRG